jgi:hypothetical protein
MARPESLALGYREVRNVLDRVVRDPLIDAARSSGHQTGYWMYVPEGGPIAGQRLRNRYAVQPDGSAIRLGSRDDAGQ